MNAADAVICTYLIRERNMTDKNCPTGEPCGTMGRPIVITICIVSDSFKMSIVSRQQPTKILPHFDTQILNAQIISGGLPTSRKTSACSKRYFLVVLMRMQIFTSGIFAFRSCSCIFCKSVPCLLLQFLFAVRFPLVPRFRIQIAPSQAIAFRFLPCTVPEPILDPQLTRQDIFNDGPDL